MYNLETLASEKDELQKAVLNARAYKPLYVKIKINYGCNLKCQMCKHWRETRETPIPHAALQRDDYRPRGTWLQEDPFFGRRADASSATA